MPINPLIRSEVNCLDVPDKIRGILNEILDAEVHIEAYDENQAAASAITKILVKYANDEDVVEFCSKHG